MAVEDDKPLHTFPDRALRQSLEHPENLKSFLHQAIPGLADHFVYERARRVDREFPLDDWRRRENDLLFEIPFREGGEVRTILVCVLIEHQSEPDPLMPLRMLLYAVLYWEKSWKAWEGRSTPRSPLRLPPVIPIVLHTCQRKWSSNRSLADLVEGAESLRPFVPNWQPIFWELSEQDPHTLVSSGEAWLELMAVIRAEKAEAAEFEIVFRDAIQQLESLYGNDRVRWYDMLRLVLTWAVWRRPNDERQRWIGAAVDSQKVAAHKTEVKSMGKTIAEAWLEEGETKGAARQTRKMIVKYGTKALGDPGQTIIASLESISDVERLERIYDKIDDAKSWAELLQTP